MERCEVCQNLRPGAAPIEGQRVVTVSFEGRLVTLCTGHARIAENSGVTSFEQLRELYGTGRRSFVPRRAPRKPAPVDYLRQGAGRRATDARR
jgi:hypothetical protein